MQYLYELKHYEDRYDLWTIEQCLRDIEMLRKVTDEVRDAKELNHMTDSHKETQMDILGSHYLQNIMLNRYKRREATIQKWMDEDRRQQELQDNTLAPRNIKCNKCEGDMKDTMHHLHSNSGAYDRVLFFFECKNCKARKGVFDDGEEWIRKSDLCKKCNSEIKNSFETKGDYEIWTEKCTKCDCKKIDRTNIKQEKLERESKEKREKELLEKYRDRFCLEKDEAEKIIQSIEEIKFANEVYKYELQKNDTPEFEQAHNLNKLAITELKEVLNKALKKALKKEKYEKLSLKDPKLDRYVEVSLSTQDLDKSRNSKESTTDLKTIINKTLETTNWRLIDSISHRLGFLTANLRGYERDEDILKTLVKKKPEPKLQLDPEREKKYGHSGAVQIAKWSAEFEVKKKLRMKRYKDEPEGFLLETHGENYYTCGFCMRSRKGNELWWIPEAQLCFDCRDNLNNEVFPIEALENSKQYFSTWDLEREFGVHHRSIPKLIKNGELISRDLKEKNGRIYKQMFLAKDNVEFFKNNKRIREREKRWHYVDDNGEVIWL